MLFRSAVLQQGREVFADNCERCHGNPETGAYPNLLVPQELVGTDDALASLVTTSGYTDWYNASFYGRTSRMEPSFGYTPPPLDGIWATAPFLHNGSVPTLAALLDSSTRPTQWRRSADYDDADVGWKFDVVDDGGADSSVYDTTRFGYSNAGHTFGDALSPSDRSALIALLKTF